MFRRFRSLRKKLICSVLLTLSIPIIIVVVIAQVRSQSAIRAQAKKLPTCTMPVNVILMTTHDDAEGLKAYAEHPAHVAVGKELIKLVTESRQAIDYTF